MDSIIKKDSGNTGKTLAVFCGVHGNEKAGVFAVEKILKNIELTRGAVYFVFANPEAVKKNVRFVDKNLNRCFFDDQSGETYEEKRAIELMSLLDECDALLDIHASNNKETTPFAITDNGAEVVSNMDFTIVATGFNKIEPGGTDGYMKRKNTIGICLECGYSGESEKNTDLAYNSILQFLQYYNCIESIIPMGRVAQKALHVDDVQKVTSEEFELTETFADCQTIEAGTVIADDESRKYVADKERVILFGSQGKPIGAEAYILGNWVS